MQGLTALVSPRNQTGTYLRRRTTGRHYCRVLVVVWFGGKRRFVWSEPCVICTGGGILRMLLSSSFGMPLLVRLVPKFQRFQAIAGLKQPQIVHGPYTGLAFGHGGPQMSHGDWRMTARVVRMVVVATSSIHWCWGNHQRTWHNHLVMLSGPLDKEVSCRNGTRILQRRILLEAVIVVAAAIEVLMRLNQGFQVCPMGRMLEISTVPRRGTDQRVGLEQGIEQNILLFVVG